MLFCLNDGVSWNIAGSREALVLQRENPAFTVDTGKWSLSVMRKTATSILRTSKSRSIFQTFITGLLRGWRDYRL